MCKVPTLYSDYQECILDLDIYGKLVATPQQSIDDLTMSLFEEFKRRKPLPTLEYKRYELSRLVNPDYRIAYNKELELQDNESLVELKDGESSYESINFDNLSPLIPDVVEAFSYDMNITDAVRQDIISKYDLDTGEEFKPGIGQTENIVGSVEEDRDTVLSDEEIERLGVVEDGAVLDINESYEPDIQEEEPVGVAYEIDEDSVEYNDDEEDFSDYEDDEEDVDADDEEEDSEEDFDDDEVDFSDYEDDEEDEEEDLSDDEEEDDTLEDEEEDDLSVYGDDDEEALEDEEDSEDFSEEDGEYDDFSGYDEDDDESEDFSGYDEVAESEEVAEESTNKDGVDSFIDSVLDEPEFDTVVEQVVQKQVEIPVTPVQIYNEVKKEEVVDRSQEPTEIRAFLRKHPRCEYEFALKYFTKKQINDAIKIGKIVKKGNILKI